MTELGKFPPDIMREAEYWWRKDGCSTPNANLYARAILAERERAARIAETAHDDDDSIDRQIRSSIADDIRKGANK